jgi:acyl carrier protein
VLLRPTHYSNTPILQYSSITALLHHSITIKTAKNTNISNLVLTFKKCTKMEEEMKDVVLQYVIDEYLEDEDEEILYDTPLISGGIVDSFSMVSLKRFLENKYKISIPDDKATPEAFDSVNKIVSLVKEFIS